MRQYLELLKGILREGDVVFEPRTKEYTIGLAGWQSIYNLEDGFPLVTTKKVNPRLPFEELLWKLRGERSINSLFERNVHIWDENAFQHCLKERGLEKNILKHSKEWERRFVDYKTRLIDDHDAEALGDLGPVYGYQWRHGFKRNGQEIDQLKNVIDNIKKSPYSRYHLMSAWNPSDLPDSALGPCPLLHHFHVFRDKLDLHVYQRSCDSYLGVPFNIAQDSLLNHLVAKETGLKPRKFIHTYGNVHIYLGVPPRANFWTDSENVNEFKKRFSEVKDELEYLGLRDWYLQNSPDEEEHNKSKDHVPYVLEQLSKKPKSLPNIELKDINFWDAIKMNVRDIVEVKDYNPHEWDAKARMAV